jgi:hypothetical protein
MRRELLSYKDCEILRAMQLDQQTIDAGKRAFYAVLDMPPFSDATVEDIVSAIACAVISESLSDKPTHAVQPLCAANGPYPA